MGRPFDQAEISVAFDIRLNDRHCLSYINMLLFYIENINPISVLIL